MITFDLAVAQVCSCLSRRSVRLGDRRHGGFDEFPVHYGSAFRWLRSAPNRIVLRGSIPSLAGRSSRGDGSSPASSPHGRTGRKLCNWLRLQHALAAQELAKKQLMSFGASAAFHGLASKLPKGSVAAQATTATVWTAGGQVTRRGFTQEQMASQAQAAAAKGRARHALLAQVWSCINPHAQL